MDEHCGWVKALATDGRWLFSCACNTLHQWDLMWTNPRHVGSTKLFNGDILDIAAGSGKVFSCGTDGAIHSWEISNQGGFQKANSKEGAHQGRVSSMALHKDMLYTVGFDGHLKVWDASSMDLLVDISGAHEGKRIRCVTMGPDGTLYTGGDDKMVRRWTPGSMRQKPPLYGHNGSVRVLSPGGRTALVSGDAEGHLLLWSV
ncbi:unnamed protein product [Ostreobium quekettii]|uniref:Uncharacterized protein n=1 Tax=Ostreobium quekettii TaxID=121088 RepID=A0A8S1J3S3_9CHLO|nr:unnamed protein product [Ostreobium quekettii]